LIRHSDAARTRNDVSIGDEVMMSERLSALRNDVEVGMDVLLQLKKVTPEYSRSELRTSLERKKGK
jgi:hypothetical protein